MSDSFPATFGLAILQAIVLAGSSIALSVQRAYQVRHQGESTLANSHFKEDTVRDINTPFSNGNRMSRIIFETFVLTLLSGYVLVNHATETPVVVFPVIGSAITLITWIYCFVLAATASRFPLPNNVGWMLNVHLWVLYTILLVSSVANLMDAVWNDIDITLAQALPFFLPVILGFDLWYTTATVKNGSPFVDENGKSVNGYNVESILGTFYFEWITPIINLINAKSSKLSDADLPTLPTTHRSHYMYYIFGESRGKKLLKRLYLGNRYSINMQGLLGLIIPTISFSTPFFLNRLLLVIQEISIEGDTRLLLEGLGYIFGMAICISINNLLIGQLWFFGKYYLKKDEIITAPVLRLYCGS